MVGVGLTLRWRPALTRGGDPIDPVEYNALKEFVRENPYGFESRMARDKLRRRESELQRDGITIETWAEGATRSARSVWFVTQIEGRRTGQRLHADRNCHSIADLPDRDIRTATEEEVERLAHCAYCG